jgi:putative ABC transport system substrate-binding protein
MRRREFVARIGTVSLAWPLAARAQRSIPFIGFLNSGSPNERASFVEAFRQGLKEGGYVDGKDVAIEYRWAEGRPDRLTALASELVSRKVQVIVATGGIASGLAAKSATAVIPIVFIGAGDPVKLGLVSSLGRPGGNATGFTNIAGSLHAKRLEILRDLVPSAETIVYLMNPSTPDAKGAVKDVHAAAETTGTKIEVLSASNEREIEMAFATIKQARAKAVLVAVDPLFVSRREQIVGLAARYAIPASYPFRDYAVAGGLMSYGPHIADSYRQAGLYAARILKGAKPADLPVIQATKIELVVNLKAAKKLGLAISRDFLARVDEVIQ